MWGKNKHFRRFKTQIPKKLERMSSDNKEFWFKTKNVIEKYGKNQIG